MKNIWFIILGVAIIAGLGLTFFKVTMPYLAIPQAEVETTTSIYPPTLKLAWTQKDWDSAIAILTKLQTNEPDSMIIEGWLAHTYLQKGIALRQRGHIEEAQSYFSQVLILAPQQSLAIAEFKQTEQYLQGVMLYEQGLWAEAITIFESIWQTETDYGEVNNLLYSAYYNYGLALQAETDLPQAQSMFESALALRPDMAEPRLQLAEIRLTLTRQIVAEREAGVPIEDRLIIVGIAEQRMWVFEQDELIYDFIVSTGEPGKDTAIGEFEILNKIDVAYASTWNLDMPHWLGIYWSGHLQNGIHALPVVRHTGYKLWDGYLGQRVSYGCVILSDADSETLYKWAEVGVPMKIVPSLQVWAQENEK